MKNKKVIFIISVFIAALGFQIFLLPEFKNSMRGKVGTKDNTENQKSSHAKKVKSLLKVRPNRVRISSSGKLGDGGVVIKLKGDKKSDFQKHIFIVKEAKRFAKKYCLENQGDFSKIQQALNIFSKEKRNNLKLNLNKVTVSLKFLNYQSPHCRGTISVQTNYTEQEVKF